MLLINYQNTFHPQRVSSFTPMKIHTCNSVPVSVSPTKPVARQQTKSWKSVNNLTKSSFLTVYIFPEKIKDKKGVQLFINSQQWNIIFDEPMIKRLFYQWCAHDWLTNETCSSSFQCNVLLSKKASLQKGCSKWFLILYACYVYLLNTSEVESDKKEGWRNYRTFFNLRWMPNLSNLVFKTSQTIFLRSS